MITQVNIPGSRRVICSADPYPAPLLSFIGMSVIRIQKSHLTKILLQKYEKSLLSVTRSEDFSRLLIGVGYNSVKASQGPQTVLIL